MFEVLSFGWISFDINDFKSLISCFSSAMAQDLKHWMETSGYTIKNFFNTSGNSYRELGLKDKIDQLSLDKAAELLATDGMLIKRPILIKDGNVLQVGYRKPYQELNLS
ncbi:arsenate reductase [Streptococcus dysgalactiae]|nr:arsenate reductase [Streptococcus dysgalactiae]